MTINTKSLVYGMLGSIGILVILEVIWWFGVILFYRLAKMRQAALEEE
tara:strand:+ start:479 stop:622 length:144 start_codon:yes stop_codon:yes gene_type:complete